MGRGGIALQAGAAPVFTFGTVYVLGLVANLAGLPVTAAVIFAVAMLVIAWLACEAWRFARTRRLSAAEVHAPLRRRPMSIRLVSATSVVPLGLLACALVTGVALWHRFQASWVVPPGWDAMHHGYFTRQIVAFNTLDTSVVLAQGPTDHDGLTSFYPLAYNLFIALLHVVSGLPISQLMIAATTLVAGLALPAGIFLLAHHLNPKRPLVAGFAALASSLPIDFYWILESGRTNAVLGLALVPVTTLILVRGGLRPRWRQLAIAAVAIVGITGLHTSELPLVVVLAGSIILVLAVHSRDVRGFMRWAVFALGAAAVALLPLLILEPGLLGAAKQRADIFLDPAAFAVNVRAALSAALTPSSQLGAVLTPHGGFAWYSPYAWGALVLVGCLLTIRPRWAEFRGPVVTYGFFVFLLIGLLSNKLGPFSFLTIPWYQDSGRLWWTLTVLGAIPAGISLAAIAEWCASVARGLASLIRRSRLRFRERHNLSTTLTQRSETRHGLLATVIGAGVGVALILGTAVPPVNAAGAQIKAAKEPVGEDSLAAFHYLREHVKQGDRVFDDMRVDGSLWMYIDDGVYPLFGNSPYVGAEPKSWLERLWLRENLTEIDNNSCVDALLDRYHVTYVYFGERYMADAYHRVKLDFLQRNAHFTEVFTEGGAHVFRVNIPAKVPQCSGDITPRSVSAF